MLVSSIYDWLPAISIASGVAYDAREVALKCLVNNADALLD